MLRYLHCDLAEEFQAFLLGVQRHHLGDFMDQRVQVEVDGFDIELAGVDFREIEDVVDHGQQGMAAVQRDLGVFALFFIQFRGEQEFGHTQHAIHRRADLMAHVGEELGFCFGRAIGDGFLLHQLFHGQTQHFGAFLNALFELQIERAQGGFGPISLFQAALQGLQQSVHVADQFAEFVVFVVFRDRQRCRGRGSGIECHDAA